jgi:hypothetical protein
MKFEENIFPYLEGKKFSNAFSFPISVKTKNVDRLTYIEKRCAGAKVIHMGFADHLPLIASKIKNNLWLHDRLVRQSSRCIGIDIDQEAFDFIQANYDYQDLHLHNVTADAPLPAIINEEWDYFVMGEILEHVNDPVTLLSQIHRKYGKYVKHLMVTVPNALDFTSIRMAKNHKEYINTDHRFWFTPFTLAKIGQLSGWKPREFDYCQTFLPDRWIYKRIIEKYPAFRETLIMIFER